MVHTLSAVFFQTQQRNDHQRREWKHKASQKQTWPFNPQRVMKGQGERVNALEYELRSELGGERTRHYHATGRDDVDGFTKSPVADVPVEVVAEVGAVGQVESLEDQLHFGALAELDVLAEARIQLEEALAAQVVKRRLHASPRRQASAQLCQTFVLVGQQVTRRRSVDQSVNCARAAAEIENVATAHQSSVGTGRSDLHDRRDLKAQRKINQTTYHQTMTLVVRRRTEVKLGENVVHVGRAVSECR